MIMMLSFESPINCLCLVSKSFNFSDLLGSIWRRCICWLQKSQYLCPQIDWK